MKFKVDQLPTANETCPFEPICTSNNTYDCPKYQDKLLSMPEDVDSEYHILRASRNVQNSNIVTF